MFNFATSDELYEQCWVDTQYQAVLGFGDLPPPVALRLRGAPTEERLTETVTGTVKNAFQALAGELKRLLTQVLAGEIRSMIQTEVQAVLQAMADASQSSTAAEPSASMDAVQRLNTTFPIGGTRAPSRDRGVLHWFSSMTKVPDSDPPLGLHVSTVVRNPSMALTRCPAQRAPPQTAQQAGLSPPVLDSDPPALDSAAQPAQGRRPSQRSSHLPSLQSPSSPPRLPSCSWMASSSASTSCSSPVPEAYFRKLIAAVQHEPKVDRFLTTGSQLSTMGGNWDRDGDGDWDGDWEMLDSKALIVGSSSATTSLSPANQNQRDDVKEQVLEAFHTLYGAEACPKSQAQLELCEAVIHKSFNVIAVLPTGAGKSAAWLVPTVVLPHIITVIVVPFEQLLSQHLQSAEDLGIHAI
jgi:hypothetical protein